MKIKDLKGIIPGIDYINLMIDNNDNYFYKENESEEYSDSKNNYLFKNFGECEIEQLYPSGGCGITIKLR